MNNTPTAVFYGKVIDELTGGDKLKLSPAKRDGYLDAIDGLPCIVYYNDEPSLNQDTLVGSFMFNVHKNGDQLGFECDLYDDEDNIIGNGEDSCVSYEATANSSDTAGCFFTLEESIGNVYNYQVEDWWKEYLLENSKTEQDCSKEQFKEMINNGSVDYMTFEEFKDDYDIYDYVSADFEPRYAYNEDDNEAMYRPMINAIDWISSCYPNGKLDKTKFKNEFKIQNHLNPFTVSWYISPFLGS